MVGFVDLRFAIGIATAARQQHAPVMEADIVHNGKLIVKAFSLYEIKLHALLYNRDSEILDKTSPTSPLMQIDRCLISSGTQASPKFRQA